MLTEYRGLYCTLFTGHIAVEVRLEAERQVALKTPTMLLKVTYI